MKNPEDQSATFLPDPAAIFAAALSLWQESQKQARKEKINLSGRFKGMDQFMREVMTIACRFEDWACAHIDFEKFDKVWPYLLEERFGEACSPIVLSPEFREFDDGDCLRVALGLQIPIIMDGKLPVPIDVTVDNPFSASAFKKFRIQTVRNSIDGEDREPYTFGDEPFDPEFGPPFFGIYGVAGDGLLEHIADRSAYAEAVSLIRNLVPGILLPDTP